VLDEVDILSVIDSANARHVDIELPVGLLKHSNEFNQMMGAEHKELSDSTKAFRHHGANSLQIVLFMSNLL
jgi:hypothetical protein